MYTSKINPGDTYDKLKKCITINILEIHFLELPKLFDNEVPKNENDPIVQWMQFIDEKARMAYEAREAEIRDQLTRIKSAEEKGKREGSIKVAKKLLKKGLSIEEVAEITELELEKVEELKKSMLN